MKKGLMPVHAENTELSPKMSSGPSAEVRLYRTNEKILNYSAKTLDAKILIRLKAITAS